MNKDARRLRDHYGLSYAQALQLIRDHGLTGAIDLCAKIRGREDEPPPPPGQERCVYVLEKIGMPIRVELPDNDGRGKLERCLQAGIRLGAPPGEERVVRYIPEHSTRAEPPKR